MRVETFKSTLCAAILLVLLTPAIVPVFSPKFRTVLSTIIADPTTQTVQLEVLRRATPIWSGLISLYNTSLYKLGVSPNPNQMAMGKEGYMFLGNDHVHSYDQVTHRYNLTQKHIDDWVAVLENERNYLAKKGIPLLFVVAPSTGTIYPDKLAYLPKVAEKIPTLFDRVLEQTNKKGLPLLDVRPELIAARKTANTYSKRNSHWTDYGAWVAWQKIASKIEVLLPSARMAGYDEQPEIQIVDFPDEAHELLNIEVPNEWTQPKRKTEYPDFEIIAPDGQRSVVSGGTMTGILDLPRKTHSPNASSNLRVLVVTDSMGTSLSPYWTASFKDLLQINHHVRQPGVEKFDLEAEVSKFNPQFVLYIMTERYFGLPLGDVDAFKIKHIFEGEPKAGDQFWPPKPGYDTPGVSVDPTLSKPSSIKLSNSNGPRYLKLKVKSSGAGQIYVGYQVNTLTTENWHEISDGQSDVIVPIPDQLDGNFVWIIRDMNRGNASLEGVEVRNAN